MSRPRAFLFSVTFILCLAICSPGEGAELSPKRGGNKASVSSENVDESLSAIASAYNSLNIMRMIDCLDQRFEGALEFRSEITRIFMDIKEPELLLVKDIVLPDRDKVMVRLHWFKKWRTSDGSFLKSRGTSQFVFRKTPDGLKLLSLRGANPFF